MSGIEAFIVVASRIWPWALFTEERRGVFLRHDIGHEATADENWSVYCDIQQALQTVGLELDPDDSFIEHDCISGMIRPCKH